MVLHFQWRAGSGVRGVVPGAIPLGRLPTPTEGRARVSGPGFSPRGIRVLAYAVKFSIRVGRVPPYALSMPGGIPLATCTLPIPDRRVEFICRYLLTVTYASVDARTRTRRQIKSAEL